jgi:hypothetical protein
MRLAGAVVGLVLCASALAGCGSSPREQVEAKVQQFAHATAHNEYATLCDQVLAPSLVARLTDAGVSCKQAMRIFTASVKNPTITVSRVTVKGETAFAAVVAGATGQPSSRETIRLVKTKHGWRLLSLASAR